MVLYTLIAELMSAAWRLVGLFTHPSRLGSPYSLSATMPGPVKASNRVCEVASVSSTIRPGSVRNWI